MIQSLMGSLLFFRVSWSTQDFVLVLQKWSFCFPQSYGMHAKLLQLCLTLCNPMDHSLPGSSIHGILQARILEWVAMCSLRGFSQPRDRTCVSCITGRFFTAESLGKPIISICMKKSRLSNLPEILQ